MQSALESLKMSRQEPKSWDSQYSSDDEETEAAFCTANPDWDDLSPTDSSLDLDPIPPPQQTTTSDLLRLDKQDDISEDETEVPPGFRDGSSPRSFSLSPSGRPYLSSRYITTVKDHVKILPEQAVTLHNRLNRRMSLSEVIPFQKRIHDILGEEKREMESESKAVVSISWESDQMPSSRESSDPPTYLSSSSSSFSRESSISSPSPSNRSTSFTNTTPLSTLHNYGNNSYPNNVNNNNVNTANTNVIPADSSPLLLSNTESLSPLSGSGAANMGLLSPSIAPVIGTPPSSSINLFLTPHSPTSHNKSHINYSNGPSGGASINGPGANGSPNRLASSSSASSSASIPIPIANDNSAFMTRWSHSTSPSRSPSPISSPTPSPRGPSLLSPSNSAFLNQRGKRKLVEDRYEPYPKRLDRELRTRSPPVQPHAFDPIVSSSLSHNSDVTVSPDPEPDATIDDDDNESELQMD